MYMGAFKLNLLCLLLFAAPVCTSNFVLPTTDELTCFSNTLSSDPLRIQDCINDNLDVLGVSCDSDKAALNSLIRSIKNTC